jgi:hypothetical protein
VLHAFSAIVFVISVLVTGAAAGTNEFESCRCRNGLASKEDTKEEVLEECGKPVLVYTYRGRGCPEMWLYNFGPNEFMQGICFDGDRVKKVLSLNWGY